MADKDAKQPLLERGEYEGHLHSLEVRYSEKTKRPYIRAAYLVKGRILHEAIVFPKRGFLVRVKHKALDEETVIEDVHALCLNKR